jgi:hypothetical protein
MQYKNRKERRKDIAGWERSIKDEKVRIGMRWHARRRTRSLTPSYLPKLKPFYQSFLNSLST